MQQEYFTSGYYDKISSLVVTYRDLFLTEANRFKAEEEMEDMPSITPRQLAPGTSTGKTAISQQVAEKDQSFREASGTSIQHGLVRKMTARMATLRRALEKAVQDNQPLQFYRMKTNNISHLWTQIELVYDELWEKLENPAVAGFDQAEYDQLDEMVQFQLVELSIKADQCQGNRAAAPTIREDQTIRNTVHLPKVTLPQFNGDYLKWQQFFDLFSEMIDKQPLAAVQKMWYLKANVTGEAAKLISHFAPTEDNYLAAWTLLQERYNNRRVIVATLIEKLVNQPSETSTAATTKNLHDTTRECIMALGNIGIDTKAWDPILFHLLLKKLDRTTHIRFEQSLTNPKELQKVDDFLMFLEGQFHTLEAIGLKDKVAMPQQHNRVVSSIATSTKTNSCKLCDNGNHPLYYCKKFLQQSPTERQLWVKKQRYCFNCLKNDHPSNNCKSRCCSKCDKKHNTLLHLENVVQKQQVLKFPSADEAINNIPNVTVSSAATSNVSTQGYVLLATARIRITAANGNSGDFRAILDSGSQINIVSERLIKRLSISPTKASLCIEGIGDAQKKVTQRINVKMQSTNGSLTTNLEAFVLPHIITAQPSFQVDTSNWKIPTNLLLADPDFYKQGKVDILLGAEFYLSLLEPGHIKLMTNGPTLQNTSLGWIVSGKCESSEPSAESLTCAVFGLQTDNNSRDGPLIEAIGKLWKMDEVESTEQSVSPADQQCETHFVQNMRKNVQGRFIVKLPFLENPSALGESRTMAHNRFLGLERRLQRNAVIRRQYVEFMREYESLGHMQKVNLDSIPSPKYFIPHHCVLKPESTTTKLRVVFDASAKTTTGYALNDLMHTGPTVQSELISILLRFRLSRFVFTTDIEKMYRQILIHPEDRRYQVIIWREDPTAKINYYQLNTVTYGTRAAPCLATKCLQQIANNNMQNHPLGAQLLHDNFYVDDGLGGSDSLGTAIEMQRQLIKILSAHGFNLKKWCANHPKLLQNIPQGDQEVNLDFSKDSNDSIKTLGLLWLPKADVFCVRTTLDPFRQITKRTISSDLARFFDPLGLLAPVIVKAKLFIQHLWQLKLSWDDAVPSDLDASWTAFRENLRNLDDLKIARHILKGEMSSSTQLHIFTDASEKAFGAAAYLRATLKDGRIKTRLLCAKTRVAPLKTQTLPRLELCAALVGSQLATRVKSDCRMKNQPIFFWTDSEVVLHWINAQSSSYKTFVANRVAKIQTLTSPVDWRHVSSKENPADLLSRGCSAKALADDALWFQGPMFLHGAQELWPPVWPNHQQIPSDNEKRKDEEEEEPTRRSKTARHYSLVTFLAILLMLPIVWCEPVKLTKFNPNAGIHLEHIGSSKIISSEWNLIVYYDLTPFILKSNC